MLEKRNAHSKDEAFRFNHDGFLIGSTHIDEFGTVVQVVGVGIAGMAEVKRDNGDTYFADPSKLMPYET